MEAKRNYYLSENHFDHYDEKVMTELTLYGLPMLRVLTPANQETTLAQQNRWPQPTEQTMSVQHPESLRASDAGPTLEGRDLQFKGEDFDVKTPPWGTYYTYRGDAQGDAGIPLQPRYLASTFANSGPAHGVALIGGTYTDTLGFDPVVSAPVNPNDARPEQEPTIESRGWAPAVFFGLQSLPGVLGDGTAQGLVIHLGQYDVREAIQRLYDQVSVMLYRSDSADWTPPTIAGTEARPTAGSIQITVQASDPSDVYKVLVAYTTGDGTWQSAELAHAAGETWQGTLPATGDLSFFVQAVDMAGNVAIDHNHERYYTSCALTGDVTANGVVDVSDVTAAVTQWHTRDTDATWDPTTDVDRNGVVNISDVMSIVKRWASSCQ